METVAWLGAGFPGDSFVTSWQKLTHTNSPSSQQSSLGPTECGFMLREFSTTSLGQLQLTYPLLSSLFLYAVLLSTGSAEDCNPTGYFDSIFCSYSKTLDCFNSSKDVKLKCFVPHSRISQVCLYITHHKLLNYYLLRDIEQLSCNPVISNKRCFSNTFKHHIHCVYVLNTEIIWKKITWGLSSQRVVVFPMPKLSLKSMVFMQTALSKQMRTYK